MVNHLQHLVATLDRQNMLEHLKNFPQHLQTAYELVDKHTFKTPTKSINQVVILGMGGSAIGGEMSVGLAHDYGKVPFFIFRNYQIPSWVDQNTLVVAVSYSGNTEETLSALNQAIARKAAFIAITSGGKLSEIALAAGVDTIIVPGGLPPRAAFGYLFMAQITTFWKLGLMNLAMDKWIRNIVQEAEFNIHPLLPCEVGGRAFELARALENKLPIIYTGPGVLAPVGIRWKGQISENAKMLAYHNVYPEMNHNEIVGWRQMPDLLNKIVVVHLQDEDDDERVSVRMDKTGRMISRLSGGIYYLQTHGSNVVSRMLSLVQLGDFTSFYLALLNQEDPTPVVAIDELKAYLATV